MLSINTDCSQNILMTKSMCRVICTVKYDIKRKCCVKMVKDSEFGAVGTWVVIIAVD